MQTRTPSDIQTVIVLSHVDGTMSISNDTSSVTLTKQQQKTLKQMLEAKYPPPKRRPKR